MGFHSTLVQVQVTWVGVMLTTTTMAAAAMAYPLALPNCSDSCGDVKIPYPFGTTEGCYRKEESGYFFINCNNSYGQPQPMIGSLNVTNISIEEGEMDIVMYSSINCYNQSGTPLPNNTQPWLQVPSTYTVSVTKNKFAAVGCDTYAYLNGVLNGEQFSIGCLSKCSNNTHNIVDGTCSGIGCCQIDIPTGLRDINFAAYSFNSHKEVWFVNPCSFAFIIQSDEFSFSSAYLTSLQNNRTLPMVLDWAIGKETCEEVALNKGNYICGANSNCSSRTNGSGYRCKCKKGYEGNPYLEEGCQDINECVSKDLNDCKSNQDCINEPGSYHCPCIGGYHADGDACVADQPASKSSLAINLTVGKYIIFFLVKSNTY
ncbi:wall-associated receptor kinase 2 [Quercus suber]|uniref:wall-associated receptor kinase 2 n=1 Tax=Quercus suber TaxID=58331 RepID=UPI0032E05154